MRGESHAAVSALRRSRSAKAAGAPSAVVVRTYNYAAVLPSNSPPRSRRPSTSSTARASHSSGSTAACRAEPQGAACTEPLLAGRDLMLRLVDRTPVDRRAHRRAGRVDARSRAARRRADDGRSCLLSARLPARRRPIASTLLGRAVAHEIGPPAARQRRTSAAGLMRALWSHDELRGLKPAHWGFSAREAAQMRQTRLRARIADERRRARARPYPAAPVAPSHDCTWLILRL